MSGSNLEEACDKDCLGLHVLTANIANLPLSDHRHPLVASQRPSWPFAGCRSPSPGSDQPFDPAVVLLDDVVQAYLHCRSREKRHSSPARFMSATARG